MTPPIPGRNQPCPCGSKKKYKHCCAARSLTSTSLPFEPRVLLPEEGNIPISAAIQLAIRHHQAGRLRRAEAIYRLVLKEQAENVDALHLLGLIKHQLGENELAFDLISKAISLNQNVAIFYNNLGETCRAMNRLDEACTLYKKALALQPKFPEAYRNLGLVSRCQNKMGEAIAYFNKAIAINPAYIDGYLALGEALHVQRKFDEAIATYEQALTYQPDNPALLCQKGIALRAKNMVNEAIQHYQQAIRRQPKIPEFYNNLAIVYQDLRNFPEAAACFRKVLELRPNDDSTRHLLNAMENTKTDRAPAVYVRETFDHYADGFERHLLEKLEYQTPTLLSRLIKDTLGSGPHALDILDLGCGTGLFGVQAQNIMKRLIGIDLSPKMIAKAREKEIYDQLTVGDLLEYLAQASPGSFDLVAAADVFNYLGNLQPVFANSHRSLRPGGLFAFSLEAHPDLENDFLLDKTGRYLHSRKYIQNLTAQCGFSETQFTPTTIRKQGGMPVEGYLCLLIKTKF